ncbi:ABC transporter substrate-binding protein [Rhodococcus sp. YH1]|jgi:ABC-type nitrate/sulfonate/bicarbonate transport system substrate-binding protein|uniref:ABC transporter substrate-binding protein n=1 Tax=Rhodococcus TaxID=1827 RepID=UPI0013869275|nr:Formylaminopyrimidine-binding protein [Rhodococcus sp. YH1]
MTTTSRLRRRLTVLAALTAALLLTASCAGGTGDDDSGDTIRFALDWTPNTNHTGLYVAQQEGLFADAGLDVEFLPYNNTTPDTLVDAGNAEFGISTQAQATFSRAAGSRTVSVLAPLQHWATGIAVKADRADLTRPRDLDGRTYAGFGDPGDEETLAQVIRNDGGRGDFTSVTLGTSAYEAVYSGTADFTVSYLAWEGIEAEHRGLPMRYFRYTDYGFPDAYAIVIDGNEDWLAEHPDQARAFVQAVQRGYEIAAQDPDRGARALIEAEPGAFPDEDLVYESQRMLSAGYLRDENGRVGTLTLERWTGYSRFLFEKGLLSGPDGKPLTTEPDWSTYFTDDYLTP